MSVVGETLFGGSRFIRWSLTPVVIAFAVWIPFMPTLRTPVAYAALAGMEIACTSLLAGLWLPPRYGRWAFRILCTVIFCAYGAYLVYEFFFTSAPLRIAERRSAATPRNALLGFVTIGLPCLWYAALGRFSLRKQRAFIIGIVLGAEPGESLHVVLAPGRLTLTQQGSERVDALKAFLQTAVAMVSLSEDGTFTIDDAPPGTYTIAAFAAKPEDEYARVAAIEIVVASQKSQSLTVDLVENQI